MEQLPSPQSKQQQTSFISSTPEYQAESTPSFLKESFGRTKDKMELFSNSMMQTMDKVSTELSQFDWSKEKSKLQQFGLQLKELGALTASFLSEPNNADTSLSAYLEKAKEIFIKKPGQQPATATEGNKILTPEGIKNEDLGDSEFSALVKEVFKGQAETPHEFASDSTNTDIAKNTSSIPQWKVQQGGLPVAPSVESANEPKYGEHDPDLGDSEFAKWVQELIKKKSNAPVPPWKVQQGGLPVAPSIQSAAKSEKPSITPSTKETTPAQTEAPRRRRNFTEQTSPTTNTPLETRELETPTTRERISGTLQSLQEKTKLEGLDNHHVSVGIIGDSNKIENQQLDFIQEKDKTVVSFKLTEGMSRRMQDQILAQMPDSAKSNGKYSFQSSQGVQMALSDSIVLQPDEFTSIHISTGRLTTTQSDSTSYSERIRALEGAVRIEIKGNHTPEEISAKLETALQALELSSAQQEPNEQAERTLKEARYRWQHHLEDDDAWEKFQDVFRAEHQTEVLDTIQRQEVLPGYFTMVEPRAQDRYQQNGEIKLFHRVYSQKNLKSILKDGLLSSQERFKRGIFSTGHSTQADFGSGGADSIFLRAAVGNQAENAYVSGIFITIKPEVLDRMDWYSYNNDHYGTTEENVFATRPTPEEFFEQASQKYSPSNEIMMRRGISPDMFESITVIDNSMKEDLINELTAEGITEIQGKPLNEFIQIADSMKDIRR